MEEPAKEPIIKPLSLPIPKIDATNVIALAAAKAGLDIEAVGKHEGIDIFDVDLDSFEDKPWRKPGADLTDYFNFGFNEASWNAYSEKQKNLREEQKRKGFEHRSGMDFDFQTQDLAQYSRNDQKYQRTDSRRANLGKRSREDSRDRDEYSRNSRPGSPKDTQRRDRERDRSPRRR